MMVLIIVNMITGYLVFLGDSQKQAKYSPQRPQTLYQGEMRPVKMYIQNTIHYNPQTSLGAAQFSRLLPAGGHLVHLNTTGEDVTYTVAMFHQLRCLDIIRNDYVSGTSSPLLRHCFNYLRQSILCLSDTRLESVRSPLAPTLVSLSSDHVCRDWTSLYAAAEMVYNSK
ncbi:unnamed protein product [Somion occarium]|uniref:Uncharacterized protein n=2 Tax=Somion occarium TaxID=3059160 RepID=A0ABP1CKK2_9APHY